MMKKLDFDKFYPFFSLYSEYLKEFYIPMDMRLLNFDSKII
jgi:hypothetical protein